MHFLPVSGLGRITKLWMIIVHFLATNSTVQKTCHREEIIQSDSPLGDMFPRFHFCASWTVPKHRWRTFPHSEKEKWRKTLVSVSIVLKI